MNQAQILEGSRAIALTIKNIKPAVISAYPITPQTHIVEDLAKFKADGQANYEFTRAESEFAAASIVEGANATGARVYTATSSQGLLLMTEVLFNIAGMRLPVVLTCANRGVSAPITIWNDQQDSMTIRDAGWIMFYAENHQEAVNQHILAYKIAEKTNLPAMVNIDGFVLTHSYEEVRIPSRAQIKKFLPDYKPKTGEYLDPNNPTTLGAFAAPKYYMEIREELHNDLLASQKIINQEYKKFNNLFKNLKNPEKRVIYDSGAVEYYGPKNPQTILIAMGSVIGTIKDVADQIKNVGVLKIKLFRPLPADEILSLIKKAKKVAVLEKAISLGHIGPLAGEIKAISQGKIKAEINSYIIGLGGRDVTKKMIQNIIKDTQNKNSNGKAKFVGKI